MSAAKHKLLSDMLIRRFMMQNLIRRETNSLARLISSSRDYKFSYNQDKGRFENDLNEQSFYLDIKRYLKVFN